VHSKNRQIPQSGYVFDGGLRPSAAGPPVNVFQLVKAARGVRGLLRFDRFTEPQKPPQAISPSLPTFGKEGDRSPWVSIMDAASRPRWRQSKTCVGRDLPVSGRIPPVESDAVQ